MKGFYYVAGNGQSCYNKCREYRRNCYQYMNTLNSTYHFDKNGINCLYDIKSFAAGGKSFWRRDTEPYYDTNTNTCIGFINVNNNKLSCESKDSTSGNMRRLCYCRWWWNILTTWLGYLFPFLYKKTLTVKVTGPLNLY